MKRVFFILIFTVLTGIVFSGCSSTPVRYRRYSGLNEYVEKALSLDQDDYPDVNGVVVREFEDVNITLLRGIGIETFRKVHKVKRIFRNTDRYTSVSIFLSPEDRIASLSARVISPDGKIKDLDEKDIYSFKSIRESGGQTRQSQRIRFNLPRFEEGSVIEYGYTIVYRGRFFANRWDFAWHNMKVLESEAIVRIPNWFFDRKPKWNLKYKVYNYPDMPEPEITRSFGQYADTVYRFHLKDVPPYVPEPRMVHRDHLYPHVRIYFGRFRNPGQYARWFYNSQIRDQLEITESIEKKAKELAKGAKTEMEKIERVKEFVESLHYNADHIGFGHAIKPNKPAVVLRRGFGDCKDKSILLIALLKVLGIDSDPVLVLTKDSGEIDPEMPYGVFNHMITRINTKDGKHIWVDPTAPDLGMGKISWMISDTWGLVLKTRGKNYMVKLPSVKAEENGIKINTVVNLSENLDVTYNYEIVYSGLFAHILKEFAKRSSETEVIKDIRGGITERFFKTELSDLELIENPEDGSIFTIKFTLSGAKASEITNSDNVRVYLKPFFNDILPSWRFLWETPRKSAVRIGDERHSFYNVTVNLPENFSLKSAKTKENFAMPQKQLKFSVELDEKDGKVTFKENTTVNKNAVNPEHYEDLRKFAEMVIGEKFGSILVGPSTSSSEIILDEHDEDDENDG